jgi:hypothetical protein
VAVRQTITSGTAAAASEIHVLDETEDEELEEQLRQIVAQLRAARSDARLSSRREPGADVGGVLDAAHVLGEAKPRCLKDVGPHRQS